MKIASSAIDLQASHLRSQSLQVSERLQVWAEGRPRERNTVNISAVGRAAQDADAAAASTAAAIDDANDVSLSSPRLYLLIRLVEEFTGKRMTGLGVPKSMVDSGSVNPVPQGGSPAPRSQASGGPGFSYDFSAHYQEAETVSFAARGVVRTADGAEIRFEASFAMARSYRETVSMQVRGGSEQAPPLQDPLVLDFGGPASALADVRFEFDLDGDGHKEMLPFVGGTGFLAFDRNGNNRIDDGRELFGPRTGNGFAELAELDEDRNGWIDEADAAWTRLRIWQPDANGEGRVQTLQEAGVGAFYLGATDTPFSLRNSANQVLGEMRASSVYLRENGSVGTVSQIDLAV